MYPFAKRIRIILDNHWGPHVERNQKLPRNCTRALRVCLYSETWFMLNLIESFFGKFSRVFLRGIRVASKEELVRRIFQYLDEVNERR
jgi:hypothetical protein